MYRRIVHIRRFFAGAFVLVRLCDTMQIIKCIQFTIEYASSDNLSLFDNLDNHSIRVDVLD